ncbi:MAG: SDR family NAD(P)-dependent oxidoreductase [Nocardioidaceae bacterium]
MTDPLQDRVAVVTGGGGGIGSEVARTLARLGASVVVNDYGVTVDGREPSVGPAQKVVDEIRGEGGTAIAHWGSVASFAVAEELVGRAVDTYGRLDMAVMTHGILRERMIFNMTEDEWDSVVDVHLKGTFNCVRHATAQMRAQRSGSIVCFTSGAGLEGNPAQANYSAAKAGIVGLTRSAALAMGRYNVSVNCIAPAAATRMTARVSEKTAGTRPASERAGGDLIASLVAALCRDECRAVTGQVYTAAGNKLARWSHPEEVQTMRKRDDWDTDEVLEAVTGALGTHRLRRFDALGLKTPEVPSETT